MYIKLFQRGQGRVLSAQLHLWQCQRSAAAPVSSYTKVGAIKSYKQQSLCAAYPLKHINILLLLLTHGGNYHIGFTSVYLAEMFKLANYVLPPQKMFRCTSESIKEEQRLLTKAGQKQIYIKAKQNQSKRLAFFLLWIEEAVIVALIWVLTEFVKSLECSAKC